MQGAEFLSSWNICLCILFSKIPNAPFSIETGHCLHFGIFLCTQKIAQSILGVRECCKGLFKNMVSYFLKTPFPSFHLFFLCCIFQMQKGLFPSFPLGSSASPAHLGLVVDPARVEELPAPRFCLLLPPLQLGPTCRPLLFPSSSLFPPA